jgi:hypothetical protein
MKKKKYCAFQNGMYGQPKYYAVQVLKWVKVPKLN